MSNNHLLRGRNSDSSTGLSVAPLSQTRFPKALSLMIAFAVIAGCGPSEPKRVAVYPVSGKVTVGGVAPEGAQIVLHSASTTAAQKFVPAGTVEKDGTFKVSSYGSHDGAPEGEYVATIAWFKVTEEGARGPDVVPQKYSSKETSPIKISVKPGSNNVPPIDIPKS